MASPAVKVTVFLDVDQEFADTCVSLPHTVATAVNDMLEQESVWDVVGVTAETSVSGVGVAVVTNVDLD